MPSDKQGKVVILGGGLAGLSAGWKLAEAGIPVQIIEKESIPGGMSATLVRDGFRYDYGGHRFITKDQNIIDEIKALMGDEFRPGLRKTQYLLWGKRLNYPLELGNLVKSVSPLVSLWCLMDYLWTTIKCKFIDMPEDSFESWTVKRFGWHLYEIFFGQYTRKIWGIPPSRISADWASQRISIINLMDAVRQLVFKPKEDPRTYTRQYYYCDLGIGRIAERMVEQITANGGEVRLSTSAQSVQMKDGRVEAVDVTCNGKSETLYCDTLINTMPVTDLILSMIPSAPDDVVDSARKLRYRAIAFVFMTIDTDQVSDNDALYVPEPHYVFFRIEQYKFWSMKMVPSPDKTSLCLEISCFRDDEVWNSSDEELFQKSVAGLMKTGLLRDEKLIKDYFVRRMDNVYPVFEIGYREHAEKLRNYVDSIPNLISYGRQGYYQYIHMHHVIAKGLIAADHIINGTSRSEINKMDGQGEYFG